MKFNIKNCVKASFLLSTMLCINSAVGQVNVDLTTKATAPSGHTVDWYQDAAKATAVSGASSVGAGTYYAFLNNGSGCVTGPATLKVVEIPCGGTTVDLSTLNLTAPTGKTVTYHSASSATNANAVSSINAVNAGVYYVSHRTGAMASDYCYSNTSPIHVIYKDCPSAVNDIDQTTLNVPISSDILTNDASTFTKVSSVQIGGTTTAIANGGNSGAIQVAGVDSSGNAVANAGTITINNDGTYTYTPAIGFSGKVNPIQYVASNADGSTTDNAILTIEVLPGSKITNNTLVANNDTNTVEQGLSVTTNVLANDSDMDGDAVSLKLQSVKGLNASGAAQTLTATPQNVYVEDPNNAGVYKLAGTASVNEATGNVTFTAANNFIGQVPLNYIAHDGNGEEDSAKLVITVRPNNNANDTVANDDASLSKQGVSQSGNVLTNDYDPENQTQTVQQFTVLNSSGSSQVLAAGTTQNIYGYDVTGKLMLAGELTINANGTYTYNPVVDYIGTVPVKYEIEDSATTAKATDRATLYLTTRPATGDFGDSPSGYPWLLAKNPSSITNKVWLGALYPDDDAAQSVSTDAQGDGAEEDGLTIVTPAYGSGTNRKMTVRINCTSTSPTTVYYELRFDWNGDKEFKNIANQVNEILTGTINTSTSNGRVLMPNATGQVEFEVSVPDALQQTDIVNTRLVAASTAADAAKGSSSTAIFTNGEVEDFQFSQLQPLLPVELKDFNVLASGNDSQLTWATASESENSHFVVERSVDGMNFIAIGQVKGNGTTAQLSNYNYTDSGVGNNAQVVYYRLKQVDLSGEMKYSKVKVVRFKTGNGSTIVYPNPVQANGEVVVISSNIEQISLYTTDGLLVEVYEFDGNANQQEISTANLASGAYLLVINGSENRMIIVE